ncbi:MAG TPA: hypothetical protein VGV93_13005 [Acidimicrobiales bacterium]|nr:hypothetical protein [Acidimicrobiales bacterium]
MADEIAIAVIATAVLATSALGAAIGYRLSRAPQRDRRRTLVIALIIAAVSPLLHAGVVVVWPGLLSALAAYSLGRRRLTGPRHSQA